MLHPENRKSGKKGYCSLIALFSSALLFIGCSSGAQHKDRDITMEAFSDMKTPAFVFSQQLIDQNLNRLMADDRQHTEADKQARAYYKGHLLWIDKFGVSDKADTLLNWLHTVNEIGLTERSFGVDKIERDLNRMRTLAFDDANPVSLVAARLDYQLTKACLRYCYGQRFGFINPYRVFNFMDVEKQDSTHKVVQFKGLFDVEMDLPTITSRYKKYTELYPSAHLAYTTNKAGTFTLGYSRRTNRPGIWKLEPYITYEDYHTRIIGNPDLKSEYIHSMELAWRKMFGQTQVTATFYARRRTGVVDYVRRAYDAGVTLDSIINAGNGWRKGLELQVTTKPTRWWQLTMNGDLSLHNFRAKYEGCTSTHNTTGTVGWINNFRLAKNTALQFDGHFVSGHHLTQGWETAYVYFDLAARQSLLKGKLLLGVVAHDIFHTARYHSLRTSTLLSSETWVRPTYPNIVFSVSYHFRQPSSKAKEGAISKEAEFVGKDF